MDDLSKNELREAEEEQFDWKLYGGREHGGLELLKEGQGGWSSEDGWQHGANCTQRDKEGPD